MAIDVRLKSITSSGGERLEFSRAGITCIVGGNNVGKSRLLREIDAVFQRPHSELATISGIEVAKTTLGSEEDVRRYLDEVGSPVPVQDGQPQMWTPPQGGQQLSVQDFMSHFNTAGPTSLQAAKPYFVWHASAGSLVGMASGSAGMPMMGGGGHPLMRLYRDGEREEELSDLAAATFGVDLTLDRVNGDVRLRIGKADVETPKLDRPTLAYADAVRRLPTLENQGDGIKSFLGLALTVMAGSAQVLLVDEPEAFLHPAQARALGRWLGKAAVARDLQIVIATHDRDLLIGLLNSAPSAVVNIVRITRDGTANHFIHLPAEEVEATWNDPVLRYSNVLQGLFHRRAVITEADGDCRFYGAVLDELGIESGRRSVADDVLFVPSGGKQKMATMGRALARLGVETFAIADFDVLRVRSDVEQIVSSLGGSWTAEMNDAYISVARTANEGALWEILKKQGVAGLPAGHVHSTCTRLLSLLRDVRVLVVPVGEMEDFDKTIGLHGSAWVTEMLAHGRHASCGPARDLLSPLLA